ncbi:MAG: cupin-like domain-containing protein [Bacteroidetes bacterium]|nr:cupin-like domain-containing protein [Bacteroidota bacterium]
MNTKTFSKSVSIDTIDKRKNLSRRELIEEYVIPGIPVVLCDGTKDWKAMGKLTPPYFKSKYGALVKEVKGKAYSIADFVDLMLSSTENSPAPYPFNLNVEEYFPELLEDFKPEILYAKSNRVHHPLLPKFMLKGTEVYELFFGGKGSSFPFLHIDALFLHTQITQIYGSKEFILYPPEQSEFMYPRKDNPKLSHVDPIHPDFEKFPLFKNAKPIRVMVHPGETILFPTGWWHSTQMYEPCISLGRIQLNAANWDAFVGDNYELWKKYKPLLAKPALVYSKMLGGLMNLQEKFM